MFFGGYERWMLRFWMLRKLDATLLDASILTQKIKINQVDSSLFSARTNTMKFTMVNPNEKLITE